MKIILPIPHKSLSPNSRNHWAVVAKHKKVMRLSSALMAHMAMKSIQPYWKQASVKILWITKTKRRPDADNCLSMLKAAMDGLQDAGAVANDRGIRYEPIDFAVDRANPRVEIEITPL